MAAKAPAKKAPAKKSTAVAVKSSTALATPDSALFHAHASQGLENVGARDLIIPRLTILQGLSPQVTKNKAEYNEDARPGQIFDVGLGEIIGDSMGFIPIYFVKQWLEWYPRNTNKGLARIHDNATILDQCTLNDKGKPILPNGNYIAETAQFYGLNMNMRNRLSFLPMASTQLKKSRQWLTLATGEKLVDDNGQEFTPPLFYRSYILTTVPESNAEGSWSGWKIDRGPALPEMEGWKDLYALLLEYHGQVASGTARGDTTGMSGEDAAGDSM